MRAAVKWLPAACGGLLAWLLQALGGWDAALQMMFLLMGLDLFTGLLCSLQGRSDKTAGGGFLSSAFFKGLSRKMMVVALVMLGAALDGLLGTRQVSRLAVIGFYAAYEGLSIAENAALLGLPFPKALQSVLERLREGDKEGEA